MATFTSTTYFNIRYTTSLLLKITADYTDEILKVSKGSKISQRNLSPEDAVAIHVCVTLVPEVSHSGCLGRSLRRPDPLGNEGPRDLPPESVT